MSPKTTPNATKARDQLFDDLCSDMGDLRGVTRSPVRFRDGIYAAGCNDLQATFPFQHLPKEAYEQYLLCC